MQNDDEIEPLDIKLKIALGLVFLASGCLSLWVVLKLLSWLGEVLSAVASAVSSVSVFVPVVVCIMAIAFVASKIGH